MTEKETILRALQILEKVGLTICLNNSRFIEFMTEDYKDCVFIRFDENENVVNIF